jgi:hypothetical protein
VDAGRPPVLETIDLRTPVGKARFRELAACVGPGGETQYVVSADGMTLAFNAVRTATGYSEHTAMRAGGAIADFCLLLQNACLRSGRRHVSGVVGTSTARCAGPPGPRQRTRGGPPAPAPSTVS